MALTGLQIQKLLPKTNCKECDCSTCLAFAMKLAAKKAELAECPYVSDEAKAVLGAAAEPPIRTVTIGAGEHTFKSGGETVVFRHEKTFVNQTGLGLAVSDAPDDDALQTQVKALLDYELERVGELLRPDAVSIAFESGSLERFLSVVKVAAAIWPRALIIRSDDVSALRGAAELLRGRCPLLASAVSTTIAELIEIAKDTDSALVAAADNFDDLVAMVDQCRSSDLRNVFLEMRADSLCEHYQNNTIIRRGALKSGLKNLGYPILTYIDTGDPLDDAIQAGIEIAKYGGLTILPTFDSADFTPLLTLRQNVFTDPQKPIQVEPQVYPVGEPDENSPVFVTTNFSLTYFLVSGEIENSGISAWLVVPECEGLSVLTAWAAGKFGGDKVGAFVKECGLADRISNRKIVIPGLVAQISGELEEALPGWEVIVGPQESGDIESFVKNVLT